MIRVDGLAELSTETEQTDEVFEGKKRGRGAIEPSTEDFARTVPWSLMLKGSEASPFRICERSRWSRNDRAFCQDSRTSPA